MKILKKLTLKTRTVKTRTAKKAKRVVVEDINTKLPYVITQAKDLVGMHDFEIDLLVKTIPIIPHVIGYEQNMQNSVMIVNRVVPHTIKGAMGIQVYYEPYRTSGYMTLYVPEDFKIGVLKDQSNIDKVMKARIANPWNHTAYSGQIGCDPEIFVVDDKKKLIPAFDFLPHKDKAVKFGPNLMHTVYWDGFQAEFTTSPTSCLNYQCDGIRTSMQKLMQHARSFNKTAKLSNKPVMDVSYDVLEKADPQHIALGCMPSLNAYGLTGQTGLDAKSLTVRSAGGHLHFGIGKLTEQEAIPIVKALDAIVGVCCVALFKSFDDPRRRHYYGLAGEYRLPPHGLEYRTLSNAWLIHPLITNLVFDLARKVVSIGQKGLLEVWKASEKETIDTIMTCDVESARHIMERNKEFLMELFHKTLYGYDHTKESMEPFYNIFYNGLETAVANVDDIEGNWNLDGIWNRNNANTDKSVQYAWTTLATGRKVA